MCASLHGSEHVRAEEQAPTSPECECEPTVAREVESHSAVHNAATAPRGCGALDAWIVRLRDSILSCISL